MMGFTRPRAPIVGFVFSGVIEEVGARITCFKLGDEVFCTTGFSLGAYAEYRCMAETDSRTHGCLALKPQNLTHEEATAAAYGGLLALQYSDIYGVNIDKFPDDFMFQMSKEEFENLKSQFATSSLTWVAAGNFHSFLLNKGFYKWQMF